MVKLSVEEPYALMRARTDLWEPWWVTARATRPYASYAIVFFISGRAKSHIVRSKFLFSRGPSQQHTPIATF
jgi:hypothetical protein